MKRAILVQCLLTLIMSNAYAQNLIKMTFYPGSPVSEQMSDSLQFRFPSFTEGVVVTKKEGAIRAKLNYSYLCGEMQFLDEKGVRMSIGNPEDVLRITVSSNDFIYSGGEYYEIIKTGNINLLKKNSLVLLPEGNEAPYGLKSQSSSVEKPMHFFSRGGSFSVNTAQTYFIKKRVDFYLQKGNRIVMIQGEGAFKKMFKGRADLVSKYVESNKVDFSNSEDLTSMLSYLNSLQ